MNSRRCVGRSRQFVAGHREIPAVEVDFDSGTVIAGILAGDTPATTPMTRWYAYSVEKRLHGFARELDERFDSVAGWRPLCIGRHRMQDRSGPRDGRPVITKT
jgi:hypothetical protein